MKKYFLLSIIFVMSLCVSAQSAQDFLNTVIEKTKSFDDISIVFNYRMINEEAGINENLPGFGSMKGNSYKINVSGQEMISNGELLWTHLIEDEEVMLSDVSEDESANPLSIIESFSDNVSVSFIDNADSSVTTLEIKENDKDEASFEKINISVDAKNFSIKNVHVFGLEGNEFVYEIIEFKTNQNLPDSMFIFDETLFPDVEVIDMR